MLTSTERAAITFDMLLTGLCRVEMMGRGSDAVAGSSDRLIRLIEGLLDEYTPADNRPDDILRQDVFKRCLQYLKGE